jgi:AmiR/NasT family two-component response regulator
MTGQGSGDDDRGGLERRIEELEEDNDALRDRIDDLNFALQAARRIGVAVGILTSERGLSDDQAFELLRAASHDTNRKLRDIADEFLRAGELPSSEAG